LGTTDYQLDFTISGRDVKPADWFAIEFPLNYFDRFADYSGVTCA